MAVKVNEINQVTQIPDAQKVVSGDGSFKFTLASVNLNEPSLIFRQK